MPLAPRNSSIATPARAEFDPAHFDAQITKYGYDVRWSKFVVCPNFSPDQPDHHRLDCSFCDGAGAKYYEPLMTRMVASSFALNTKVGQEAIYRHGSVYFTSYRGARVSFRDKLELLTSEIRYTERIMIQGSQSTYKTRFSPLRVSLAVTNTNALVDLTTVTCNQTDGTVHFSNLPGGTAFVSVVYDHHPVYIVVDVLHVVRDSRTTQLGDDTPTEFNRQVVAQLQFTRDTSDPNNYVEPG